MNRGLRVLIAGICLALIGAGAWLWATRGRESTDDAQVEAHVTPIAPRVGGLVMAVPVSDNQQVEAGTVLVQIDQRDYQLALDRARAELADAQAAAVAARADVPITATTATGNISTATGRLAASRAAVAEAEQSIEAARARLASAQARVRETEANATKAARDVERLKTLLAKDEIPQQQFDAVVGDADARAAAVESARSQVREADAGIRVAESHAQQAQAGEQEATAELQRAQTAPEQVAAMRARAQAAGARIQQLEVAVKQAELNLEHATVRTLVAGIVSRRSVEPGQVIQPGQPLMTVIPLDRVWITANFKETQLERMRPGQRVEVDVDAYGGRMFNGKIDSIAAATGARFSLLPPENATGNFVKVVQRVPVKIVLDDGQDPERLLRPGMSVTPTVYTR
ncbi:MAG: HlyD family secretion protein [Acidobacteria bacterium]|nr:HlyD family secretion protein [Acidobacteriota bacterium]